MTTVPTVSQLVVLTILIVSGTLMPFAMAAHNPVDYLSASGMYKDVYQVEA